MGISSCGVVPESTRRNTDLCLYLGGPFPACYHSNGQSIAPLLAGSTVAAQPAAPELKELSHIVSSVHLHGTRSYDLALYF